MGQELPTKKYKINGSEHEKVNEALKSIFRVIELQKAEPNLLQVNFFIYYLNIAQEPGEVVEEKGYEFDHDEVEKLVEIGNGLGFEADSEQQIARGARVDVV